MASSANNAKDGQQVALASASAHVRFGCTAKELKELMETRGVDAVNRLKHKYETVDELCRRLHVVPSQGMSQIVVLYCRGEFSPKSSAIPEYPTKQREKSLL